MAEHSRDYDGAIGALNSLQTNAKELEKQRLNKSRDFTRGVQEVREYANRVELPPSDLDRLNAIHVAGSKGKGSTSAITEHLLRTSGRTTGLYTSPHLIEARERIRINGTPISRELFAKYFWLCWDLYEANPNTNPSAAAMPTYFRYLTVMAFKVFLGEGVDVAIVEVGIGGLYDATNILNKPAVCAITQLGLEHTSILGKTLAEVTRQKAGIFKPGVAAVALPQKNEAHAVLVSCANELQVPLAQAPPLEAYPNHALVKLGIDGVHQRLNASLALQLFAVWAAVDKAKSSANPGDNASSQPPLGMTVPTVGETMVVAPGFELTPPTVAALGACRWPGRSQIVDWHGIRWFLDGAHTIDSCEAAAIWFRKAIASGDDSDHSSAPVTSPAATPANLPGSETAVESFRPSRVLVFNCTGDRTPAELLRFYAEHIEFDRALFTTGTRSVSTGKADQDNRMVDNSAKVDGSRRCKADWDEAAWVTSKGTASPPSEFLPYIEDCFSDLESYKSECPGGLEVLVTGSLHLVGAWLYEMDRPVA